MHAEPGATVVPFCGLLRSHVSITDLWTQRSGQPEKAFRVGGGQIAVFS
jgi:hypothetical protein